MMRCGEPLICVSGEECQESAPATVLPERSLTPLVLYEGQARISGAVLFLFGFSFLTSFTHCMVASIWADCSCCR